MQTPNYFTGIVWLHCLHVRLTDSVRKVFIKWDQSAQDQDKVSSLLLI